MNSFSSLHPTRLTHGNFARALRYCMFRSQLQHESKSLANKRSMYSSWKGCWLGSAKIRCTHHLRRQNHSTRSNAGDTNAPQFSPLMARLREMRQNGTPEMLFGFIILSLVSVDYALQVRNDEQRAEMYRHLERQVKHDELKSRYDMLSFFKEGNDMASTGQLELKNKPLFKCIIRHVPEAFDGHKCLTNVKAGDIVDVIEEGVGPGGQYNLCVVDSAVTQKKEHGDESDKNDSKRSVSIGWFPCSCLEKME